MIIKNVGFVYFLFTLFFSAKAISVDSIFKAPVGSIYSLEYNPTYTGANVLKLKLSNVPDKSCATLATQLAGQYFEVLVNNQYVPFTPPASGTTWNRNTVVADKTAALCKSGKDNTIVVNHFVYPKTYALYQSGGDIVHSSGGSAEKENLIKVSYEIYRKTMQTRENHQLSIK
ncbi:type 4 pilus major pilin [Samsonia erythrinae]|uniref:PilS-like protein n=1 Tax=Samsonia erythrinae TaxID=160434 RepID=A0A4R3VRA2_9GAMM|nr:type 4 pilus major pilin [Samsonia erythrinae]TCV07126.1 PilS-like protein [Samsonia erythrinae]